MEIITLDETEELADLVWLGLATRVLDVDEFDDIRVHEDVMTPGGPGFLKAEPFHEIHKICQPHIL